MRPDIVGYAGDRSLAIEVFVTHRCSQKKIDFIEQRELPTTEIHLSLVDRNTPFAKLRQLVLTSAPRIWLINALLEAALVELEERIARASRAHAAVCAEAKLQAERLAAVARAEPERFALVQGPSGPLGGLKVADLSSRRPPHKTIFSSAG